MTIRENWGDYTKYRGLMFSHVTVESSTNEDPNMEYQHALRKSGGHISTTWVLLENQSTVDVF